MSEYGNGISFAQACMFDKERIKEALECKLVCGGDENGFIYANASKEDCEAYILSAYDNAVYHALSSMAHSRATETIEKKHGFDISKYFLEYIDEVKKEKNGELFNNYKYESGVWL